MFRRCDVGLFAACNKSTPISVVASFALSPCFHVFLAESFPYRFFIFDTFLLSLIRIFLFWLLCYILLCHLLSFFLAAPLFLSRKFFHCLPSIFALNFTYSRIPCCCRLFRTFLLSSPVSIILLIPLDLHLPPPSAISPDFHLILYIIFYMSASFFLSWFLE